LASIHGLIQPNGKSVPLHSFLPSTDELMVLLEGLKAYLEGSQQ
jgi:hypothetical protein